MPCAVCLHICDIIHLLFHPLSEELLKVRSTIPNFPFPPLRPRIFFLSKCEGSHTLSFIASDEASFRTLKSVKNEFVYASVTPLREIGHIFRNLLKHSLIIHYSGTSLFPDNTPFQPLFRILVERRLYSGVSLAWLLIPWFKPAPFISIRSVCIFPLLSYHGFTFTSF